MSSTTIEFRHEVDGALADVSSVVLCDPASSYGVRRNDMAAVVVAVNTALEHASTGVYRYTFTDPAPSLTYTYWLKWVYGGREMQLEFQIAGGTDRAIAGYLTAGAAVELAGKLPAREAETFVEAATAEQQAALDKASLDVDGAHVYQGSRYDASQERAFPRCAYAASERRPRGVVWDWDETSGEATVPQAVLLAVIYQANAILGNRRGRMLEAQHDGLSGQSAGQIKESYRARGPAVLCFQAEQLVRRFAVRSGELL